MKKNTANQQLTLLPQSPVSARFQLSADTRERGMRHVAEIRQLLAERQAVRDTADVTELHPHTDQAA